MRKRKFWSVALATAVATMLPVSALAKTWDNVDSWDKLAEAWALLVQRTLPSTAM